ncbi:MAG: 2-dehydro-3-deoxygalactonokinase [Verrucomicrobiales bacterium]
MGEPVPRLISGDWGTTTLRLRLIHRDPFSIAEEVEVPRGIAGVHDAWKATEEDRETFFLAVMVDALDKFEDSVEGLEIVLSGMVSSNIGMIELDYAVLPFAVGDLLPAATIEPSERCPHRVTVFSGLRWEKRDVMRGEEAQILGLILDRQPLDLPSAFTVVLPGTHSKHVDVEEGSIVRFTTFLTGELYQTISRNTILKHAIAGGGEVSNKDAFREGVTQSQGAMLSASLFSIRCAGLFGERDASANGAYLSGLLIGSELANLSKVKGCIVVSEGGLGGLYLEALKVLDFSSRLVPIPETAMKASVPRAHAFVHDL